MKHIKSYTEKKKQKKTIKGIPVHPKHACMDVSDLKSGTELGRGCDGLWKKEDSRFIQQKKPIMM